MWGKISLAALLVVAITSLTAPDADARKGGYYRWQGDDGTVHYSQKPPEGRPYEFISTAGRRYLPEDREQQPQADPPPSETERPAARQERAGPEEMEVLPEADPEQCQQARRMLEVLGNDAVRVRLRDEQGDPRVITPEEREEQRERAREAVDVHCD